MMQKASAQQYASKYGIALIAPDTSPRGCKLPGEDDEWDFGTGASFYVDATAEPWNKHYRMYTYITQELIKICQDELPISNIKSIFGHSMGGHGALVAFLKNDSLYRSVSAFAPISHSTNNQWAQKSFKRYFNNPVEEGEQYDATLLVKSAKLARPSTLLIDQGASDEFYQKNDLQPEAFVEAARSNSKVNVQLRMHDNYDHSYYMIQTFIDQHIAFHAAHLFASQK